VDGFKADRAEHACRARGTVCLVSGPRAGTRWRLLWTLSEDDEKEADAIRAKIKSKMNTAGALGAVIVGLTTFLLQNSVKTEPDVWQWLAFAALATSAGLYFAALFLYDTLQMPPRFWSSRFPSHPRNESRLHAIWTRLRHGHPSVRRPRLPQPGFFRRAWCRSGSGSSHRHRLGRRRSRLPGARRHRDRHPVGLGPWQVLAAIVVLTAATGCGCSGSALTLAPQTSHDIRPTPRFIGHSLGPVAVRGTNGYGVGSTSQSSCPLPRERSSPWR